MVVVGWDGVGWLCVEKLRPVIGAPPFVGTQYGHRGQLVPVVGDH